MRDAPRDDGVADANPLARPTSALPVARPALADDDHGVRAEALDVAVLGADVHRPVADRLQRGEWTDRQPDAAQARQQLGAALGRDAHGERRPRRHERDVAHARGDGELDGTDPRPPAEAVVDDDEMPGAAQRVRGPAAIASELERANPAGRSSVAPIAATTTSKPSSADGVARSPSRHSTLVPSAER